MNYTHPAFLSIGLLLVSAQTYTQEASWKSLLKQTLEQTQRHPYITGAAATAVAGATAYASSSGVRNGTQSMYERMRLAAHNKYDHLKTDGITRGDALRAGLLAGGLTGAYAGYKVLNTAYPEATTKLYNRFNALPVGHKIAVGTGAAFTAGVLGWLGYKAYTATTKQSPTPNAPVSTFKNFEQSLTPAQKAHELMPQLLKELVVSPKVVNTPCYASVRKTLTADQKTLIAHMLLENAGCTDEMLTLHKSLSKKPINRP